MIKIFKNLPYANRVLYNLFMKLMIQIPCYNEEENILDVINKIPKKIKGIDKIKIIVLDDGSTDKTVSIAQEAGIEVIKSNHIGLSGIFNLGIRYATENNADILVNIDGDNQYKPEQIEKIIEPIIKKRADVVIGARPIDSIKSFSLIKKLLQKFGTYTVKSIAQIEIKDATSGFRAYNRKALLKTNIFNKYTYTIENIVQLKSKNLIIENTDIEVNKQDNRKSKLISNNFNYIFKQGINLIRFFIIYSPTKFFGIISFMLFITGTIIGCRFLYYYFNNQGSGHIQSLILCSIILVLSFIIANIAIIGDIISINRKMLEDIQEKLRQIK